MQNRLADPTHLIKRQSCVNSNMHGPNRKSQIINRQSLDFATLSHANYNAPYLDLIQEKYHGK
jgi:hypothetical protein